MNWKIKSIGYELFELGRQYTIASRQNNIPKLREIQRDVLIAQRNIQKAINEDCDI